MKIVCVGDIHGRSIWKEIAKKEANCDKFIFSADYFDSKEGVSPEDQKLNFEKIIRFKRENKDKVILLFGNHDFHYLEGIQEQYSGWQMWSSVDIRIMFNEALKEGLMKMCHIEGKYLFSHAGLTKTWCKSNLPDNSERGLSVILEKQINQLFKYRPKHFGFVTKGDIYGDHPSHSPIWVRPRSLKEDRLDQFIQIVGHTAQDCIKLGEDVILIDTLGTSGEYLVIEDGNVRVGLI